MTDVIGLDLSLTCTGVAGRDWTRALKPPSKIAAAGGLTRLRWIADELAGNLLAELANCQALVAVEGPSYGSPADRTGKAHERAGLWWLVADALGRNEYPLAVVPPTSLKRYATGRGNAGKDEVLLAAARRFAWFDGGNDAADALWLAAMAADHLGRPMADLPTTHRAALTGVAWPTENA